MKTISFVIPVYNEEKRLYKTFEALDKLRVPHGLVLKEVIFVDDGSVDKTELRIRNYESWTRRHTIKLLTYYPHRGKGYAVRQGMLASSADYTVFFDADMSTPLSELEKFLLNMERDVDVIVGTRKNGKSSVIKHQPRVRELLGRCFTLLVQAILGINTSDVTCGFKAFSRNARSILFPLTSINGWGYDAELLLLTKKLELTLTEVPVVWTNDQETRVSLFKDIPLTFLELGKIYWMHKIKAPAYIPAPLLNGLSETSAG